MRLAIFVETLYDDTQEGPQWMTVVKIGTGSPPKSPFLIVFWGHISAPDQDIF